MIGALSLVFASWFFFRFDPNGTLFVSEKIIWEQEAPRNPIYRLN